MVTPSSRPVAASSLISATSAVSTKNFMGTLPLPLPDESRLRCGPVLHPGRAGPEAPARGVSRCCCRTRFPARSTIWCRRGSIHTPATWCPVPLVTGREVAGEWSWDAAARPADAPVARGRPAARLEAADRRAGHAADAGTTAAVRRLDGRLRAGPARGSDGDGAARARERDAARTAVGGRFRRRGGAGGGASDGSRAGGFYRCWRTAWRGAPPIWRAPPASGPA